MSLLYQYTALDQDGRKVRGALQAETARSAHEQLECRGLAPLRLAEARPAAAGARPGMRLGRRELADFLHDAGALAGAGVDFRSALGVLAQSQAQSQARPTPSARLARALEEEIAGGQPVDAAFARVLGPGASSVTGLVAAGEARGDLGGALNGAAETLESELEATEAIVSAVSYPGFILAMTVGAVLVILFVVVPSLAPLAEQSQEPLPAPMAALFALSASLRANGTMLAVAGGLLAAALVTGWRLGALRRPFEAWLLDGPIGPIARGLVFGGVAANLGALLAASVPAGEALQLARSATSLRLAQERLDGAAAQVREGVAVSQALASCRGMPPTAVRLAAIGEEAGRLGPMLERAGRLERSKAMRRIRFVSQWLGPLLIIGLGGLIGLIMAGLLSSLSSLADTATAS
jgi:type II secretory pathway component PulF